MNIKFLKSPIGKYGLSYSVGDVVDLEDKEMAGAIIDDKYGAEASAAEVKSAKAEKRFYKCPKPKVVETEVEADDGSGAK